MSFSTANEQPRLLSDDYRVEASAIEALEREPLFRGKVHPRGAGCVVSIKPLVDRERMLGRVNDRLKPFQGLYRGMITGRTTIDVMRRDYGKRTMLGLILRQEGFAPDRVVFVGNEVRSGTEEELARLGITAIQVEDPYECNVVIRTIASLSSLRRSTC